MIAEPAWVTALIYLVTDESKHFALASVMGSVGFWWMLTIWFVTLWGLRRLAPVKVSMAVVFGIPISCWLVGLSLSWVSHWALDYFSTWWVTPLGPSLNLIMP